MFERYPNTLLFVSLIMIIVAPLLSILACRLAPVNPSLEALNKRFNVQAWYSFIQLLIRSLSLYYVIIIESKGVDDSND
jgi:predicted ferric reductase